MKYLLLIFVLVAVLITAGCTEQLKYKGTINDNKYLDEFSRASFSECNYNIQEELKYNNMAGVYSAARACAEFMDTSQRPNDGKLQQSRDLIISGYTKMARGDLDSGITDIKAGNKIVDEYVAANKL